MLLKTDLSRYVLWDSTHGYKSIVHVLRKRSRWKMREHERIECEVLSLGFMLTCHGLFEAVGEMQCLLPVLCMHPRPFPEGQRHWPRKCPRLLDTWTVPFAPKTRTEARAQTHGDDQWQRLYICIYQRRWVNNNHERERVRWHLLECLWCTHLCSWDCQSIWSSPTPNRSET